MAPLTFLGCLAFAIMSGTGLYVLIRKDLWWPLRLMFAISQVFTSYEFIRSLLMP